MLDWLLHIVPQRIEHVVGHFHENLVWKSATIEDHVHALITFESGATADVQLSNIQAIGKPRWRLLGAKGGVVDLGVIRAAELSSASGQPEPVPHEETLWL